MNDGSVLAAFLFFFFSFLWQNRRRSHLNVVLFREFSHGYERARHVFITRVPTTVLFMGFSRIHVHARARRRTHSDRCSNSEDVRSIRGESFMLPRDKVHSEPFSKIDHDGAGHGYLVASTINVEDFLRSADLSPSCTNLLECRDTRSGAWDISRAASGEPRDILRVYRQTLPR